MFTFKFAAVSSLAVFVLHMHAAQAALPADLPLGYQVTAVSMKAVNDIAFNATSNELLASVGSAAGYGVGNSITRISMDGSILGSLFVGSEPGKIALSADGLVGYVAIQAAPTIKQFDALTGTTTGSITLPGSAYNGSTRAEDIAVSPDNANVIAVSVRNTCCSPRHEGVFIIQDGQTLPNRTRGHTGSNTIEFGADGSTLYGYNNETTEFGFRTMAVNGSGVQTTSVTQNPLYGFYETFTYEQGLAYSSQGVVFNPQSGEALGAFAVPYGASFTASVADKRAYSLDAANVLTVYDLDTFTPITTFDLAPQLADYGLSKLIHTDSGNLAAIGSDGIYVLSAVPEASTMWMSLIGLLGLVMVHRQSARRASHP